MIEVKGLGKRYKGNDFYSLKNANFTIEEGDIVGLVGKNGSEKSTLLKLLAKSQNPTEGTVFFNGKDIFKEDNILRDFGIMIEPVFFPQISVEENVKLYLKIHKKEQHQDNIEKTLKLVGLWEAKNRKPVDFSFGMKQRTALALALVTEPRFVLLDEPFVGLDPIGVRNLLDILKQWSKVNKTSMIIFSHQLAELEELCTRYLFIESGTIDDKISAEHNSIIIELNEMISEEDGHLIENLVKNYYLKYSENCIEIDNSVNNEALNAILEQLAVAKLIKNVLSKKDSLERLFTEE
nr:ABC transporter ATP-binding protein [uncultured Streptococcus sp.]